VTNGTGGAIGRCAFFRLCERELDETFRDAGPKYLGLGELRCHLGGVFDPDSPETRWQFDRGVDNAALVPRAIASDNVEHVQRNTVGVLESMAGAALGIRDALPCDLELRQV